MKGLLIALAVAAALSLYVSWVSTSWSECRAFGHSWGYCFRVVIL